MASTTPEQDGSLPGFDGGPKSEKRLELAFEFLLVKPHSGSPRTRLTEMTKFSTIAALLFAETRPIDGLKRGTAMAKKRRKSGAFGKLQRSRHESLVSGRKTNFGNFSEGVRYPVILVQELPGELGAINPKVAERLREMSPPEMKACAENIHVLLAKLKAEDDDQFLYRGQTRHFPALVPSIFRRAIIPGTEGDPVIRIDPVRFDASLTERDRMRAYLLRDMMRTYGPSVGNILAQQYCMSSEALDVTSDPTIAAFFATKRYPDYGHYVGSSGNPEGVVYRFPVREKMPDLETLDTLYKMACKRIEPFGDVFFLAYRKRQDLDEELASEIEKIFRASGGSIRAEVRTRPLVVNHAFYKQEIRSSWSRRLLSPVPELNDTRLLRQQGGSIRTPSRRIASIPHNLAATLVSQFGFVFDPPIAIGEELIGVENISRYPNLEIFPFRHSREATISLEPDYLWPGKRADWIYAHLSNVFASLHEEYLEKNGVAVDDFQLGLIDPGYQPLAT